MDRLFSDLSIIINSPEIKTTTLQLIEFLVPVAYWIITLTIGYVMINFIISKIGWAFNTIFDFFSNEFNHENTNNTDLSMKNRIQLGKALDLESRHDYTLERIKDLQRKGSFAPKQSVEFSSTGAYKRINKGEWIPNN